MGGILVISETIASVSWWSKRCSAKIERTKQPEIVTISLVLGVYVQTVSHVAATDD